ncbi:MAG: hypothetical protein VYE18_05950 [Pseudomonadota bacterium]|nr:hypothetical protein [Pseudomonadota bacterium]
MVIPGIEFVAGLFSVAAVIFAAVGLFLVFLDLGAPSDAAGSGIRRSLSRGWERLGETGWRRMPALAAGRIERCIDSFIDHWFGQAEDNVLASSVFMATVLVLVPLAALVNLLRGGSAFFILSILAIFLAYVLLLVLSEMHKAQMLCATLSIAIFVAIFFFVPGYVFVSLTERLLNMPIGHAALGSILAAPLLYFVCQSAVLVVRLAAQRLSTGFAKSLLERQFVLFAAVLPFVYLTTYGAFLAGHLAVADLPMHTNWRMMLASMVATGIAAAITLEATRPAGGGVVSVGRPLAGLLLIALLSLAVGPLGGGFPDAGAGFGLSWQVFLGFDPRLGRPAFGPLFWLVHQPFLPPLLVVLVFANAVVAKLVLAVVSLGRFGFWGVGRPYLLSGIALALMGVIAASLAAAI